MSDDDRPYIQVEYFKEGATPNSLCDRFYFGDNDGEYETWFWRYAPEAQTTFLFIRNDRGRVEIPKESIRAIYVHYKPEALRKRTPPKIYGDATTVLPRIPDVADSDFTVLMKSFNDSKGFDQHG